MRYRRSPMPPLYLYQIRHFPHPFTMERLYLPGPTFNLLLGSFLECFEVVALLVCLSSWGGTTDLSTDI